MRLHTLVFASALLPLSAIAQDFDYTFVEAAYLDSELDAGPLNVDGDGFGLRGSVLITDSVFLRGEYASYDYNRGIDATRYAIGAGMRWGLRPELDLVADLSWVRAKYERPVLPSIRDDGFGLGVGLRSRVHDAIEVEAGIRHIDLDRSETFLTLGGRYYFNTNVAATLGLDLNDDNTGWSLGLRAEFGR